MALNLDAVGKKIGPITREFGWKEFVLYALGVGAGFDEIEYVYERELKVIPSFAILAIYDFFTEFFSLSGVDMAGILHGEHDLIIHSPIPAEGGTFTSEGRIRAIYDKGAGKGALVIGEIDTYHAEGHKLFTNVITLFSRRDGGFGGPAGPKESFAFPDREPDFEELARPSPDQPLLYRLSGDTFALHVDPDFARMSGFDQPIMHGLCTHGYACRAIMKHLFPGEPERMTRFRNRFSRALYPGVPIKTQIWRTGEGEALFRTVNAENGAVVIDRGVVEWMSRQDAERRAAAGGIRFDGRVAIVTGAGGGLGRAYALELARRGAKVVVNDLGGSRDGIGESTRAADAVVAEIEAAGGTAVASYDSVATLEGGERIVGAALDAFGRVDILINNAGILRDKSFAKMTPEMWKGVLDVHLTGAYNVTRPAFRAMREANYGRIVMTTSAAGLFGNFGQANYGTAKMGLVGMVNTLRLEVAKYRIQVNAVAPLAATRLTEDVLPPDLLGKLYPDHVVPLVLYLCSERCPADGGIYNAGMGFYSRAAVVSGPGIWLNDRAGAPSPEAVAARWQDILALDPAQEYPNANTALIDMLTGPREAPVGGDEKDEADGGVPGAFERMCDAFQPEAAAGIDVVFQFEISGPGGGDWHVIVADAGCRIAPGVHGKPTTTFSMSAEDFLSYVGGQLPAMQAYTTGRLKIVGDLMKSQLVEKLFKFP